MNIAEIEPNSFETLKCSLSGNIIKTTFLKYFNSEFFARDKDDSMDLIVNKNDEVPRQTDHRSQLAAAPGSGNQAREEH